MSYIINISLLRKKLIYRSLHRGCKETDILLGQFALKYIYKLSIQELIEYEKIVNLDDYDLYCYLTNKKEAPCTLSKKTLMLIANQD